MKRLLAVILMCLTSFNLMGQFTSMTLSPNNPFSNPIGDKRIIADKIHCVTNYHNVESFEFDVEIKRNSNGLSDTIVGAGGGDMYLTYDVNDRLVCLEQPYSNTYEEYTYTKDGKLLTVESAYSKAQCYYTNTGIDSMVRWNYNQVYNKFIPESKTVIKYITGGYCLSLFYYIIEKGEYSIPTNTIFKFGENRLESISYSDLDNINVNIRNEYFFDEKGYQIKSVNYNWNSKEKYWQLYYAEERTYYNNIVDNEKTLFSSDNRIYGAINNIIVDYTKIEGDVFVYNINGNLINRSKVNLGINFIPMNAGIYVVLLDGKSIKIKVN